MQKCIRLSVDSWTNWQDPKPFCGLIGKLRPDISYVVLQLSQFMSKSTSSHHNWLGYKQVSYYSAPLVVYKYPFTFSLIHDTKLSLSFQ